MDRETRHRQRLAGWRERHPRSPHLGLDLEALEHLKSVNDRLAAQDMRERPEECRSYPSFVTIGNTHKCNLTCNMCFKQLDDADNMTLPEMGLECFESLAHELFPHLRSVALSVSGEPLISRSIFDELDLLATYGVRASVTTNGMPLHRRGLLERLLPALGTLTISMDGADEPVFNSIRRGASFTKVVENIHLFHRCVDALPPDEPRPRLVFNHILQHKNVTQLPRLIELAHELRADSVHVDHVYIHAGLNGEDSLEQHKQLTNRMLEQAAETAARLGVQVRLPQPFLDEAADQAYEQLDSATLLRQGDEHPPTVPYDPARHDPLQTDPALELLRETEAAGGGNPRFVDGLLTRGLMSSHLKWGVPQLGPSLIPPALEKVSSCLYPWRESFVEYNRVVVPCCNPSLGAGRTLGLFEPGTPFREIWNNQAYRELRRSLSTGRSFGFCRFCYLVEPVDEAKWGTDEIWFKFALRLDPGQPQLAGHVPAGMRGVITELRTGSVPAGTRLEIGTVESILRVVEAERAPGGDGYTLRSALRSPVTVTGPLDVWVRCEASRGIELELHGFTE